MTKDMTTSDTAPGTWMLAFGEGPGAYMMATAPDGDWLSLAATIHANELCAETRKEFTVQDIAEMLRQGQPVPIYRIDPWLGADDDCDSPDWAYETHNVKTGLTLYAGEAAAEGAGATVVWGEGDASFGAVCHETLNDEMLPPDSCWVAGYKQTEKGETK